MGHSRKNTHLPHGGHWKLTTLPPTDALILLLLSEKFFFPPTQDSRNFLLGGGGSVWILSGTTIKLWNLTITKEKL
jgi:hypothetical protein